MRQLLEKIVIGILLIVTVVGFYTNSLPMVTIMYIGIYTNIYLIIKARKFKPVSFMLVFWLSFIINVIPYYTEGKDISGGREMFDIPYLYDQTVFNHVFFILITALFFPAIRKRVYLKDRFVYRKSIFGFTLTVTFMVLITLVGQSGQSIFAAGGYATGASQSSTLNEYFLVLVPVALVFSGNNPILRRFVFILIALYLLKDLSFGGRNGTLQNGLMLFLILDNKKIKYWQVAVFGSIPVYIMLLYGNIRVNPYVLFTSSITDVLLLPFNSNLSFYESLGTQNDVFYASVRFLGLLDLGVLQESDRIKIFFYNILAIVTPFKWLPPSANLAGFELVRYNAGGGGLVSAYWYFYLGLPGLVFIAWYICFIIKKAMHTTNLYFILYVLIFLSSYPRWVAYNPIIIFKLCIYGPLFYFIIRLIINIIRTPERENMLELKQ